MVVTKKLMTADELLRLPDDGFRHELVKGELVRMTPSGLQHSGVSMMLGILLGQYVLAHRLGRVYGADAGYCLACSPDTVRSPDVSFIARERIPAEGGPTGFWPGAPDLAVEVMSPSDTVKEIQEKVLEYLATGTRLVWVIHPETQTVTEYRSLAQVQVLTADDTLDGADVVPGFRCQVGELFQDQ